MLSGAYRSTVTCACINFYRFYFYTGSAWWWMLFFDHNNFEFKFQTKCFIKTKMKISFCIWFWEVISTSRSWTGTSVFSLKVSDIFSCHNFLFNSQCVRALTARIFNHLDFMMQSQFFRQLRLYSNDLGILEQDYSYLPILSVYFVLSLHLFCY